MRGWGCIDEGVELYMEQDEGVELYVELDEGVGLYR